MFWRFTLLLNECVQSRVYVALITYWVVTGCLWNYVELLCSENVRQTTVLLDLWTEMLPSSLSFEQNLYFSCYFSPRIQYITVYYEHITVYYERDYRGLFYLLLIRLFDHALQFILIHVRTSYINTYILNISYTSDPQFL